eukprot:TRINITY_DN1379_c0_g1_i2.p2 TRINITY_DN1379_c0_g1~~TRINITY_DN1379_c0_g1_i2.p2  ORF type:complete len:102 (-),score=30.68 TRINITY_DN1379_c0_g1_i2:42-347(-)
MAMADATTKNASAVRNSFTGNASAWSPFLILLTAHWNGMNTSGMKHVTQTMMEGMIPVLCVDTVSYTHLRAHETPEHLVCRLLLEKKKKKNKQKKKIENNW